MDSRRVGESSSGAVLSIVTVNLNNASGLRRTLASLCLFQGDSDVECIFVDGGSVDDSVEVAETFYEPKNIISEEDGGVYDAMNKGFLLAHGKFVLWLNSGDEFLPEAWEKVRAALMRTEASLLVCNIIVVDPDDQSEAAIVKGIDRDMRTQSFPHPATFFLAETVRLMRGYSVRYRISGDRDLILRIMGSGGTVQFSDILVSRFFVGGLSSNLYRRFLENIDMDRRLGRISKVGWMRLYVSHLFRHRVVLPVWRQGKRFLGLSANQSVFLRALKQVFRQPMR
jgi:glycosyltransferase involved in cell wall biosynthesis